MGVYRQSVDGGSKPKRDQQIVGEGAKDTPYQDLGSFFAGRAYPRAIISAPVPSEPMVAPITP